MHIIRATICIRVLHDYMHFHTSSSFILGITSSHLFTPFRNSSTSFSYLLCRSHKLANKPLFDHNGTANFFPGTISRPRQSSFVRWVHLGGGATLVTGRPRATCTSFTYLH